MKKTLIILSIIVAFIIMFAGFVFGTRNKAIRLEEQITNAQSEIKIQEKRRIDLIPNLVDCVKQYDKHEYETLMAVVNARKGDEKLAEDVQTMIQAVAEAYPELKSSEQYQNLMNELSTTENKIATSRTNYNVCVTRYNAYCRSFPNSFILSMTGYEKTEFGKLDYDVSDDAPTNLFGDDN